MAHTLSFLSDVMNSKLVPSALPPQPNPELGGNPDFIIILAALCCALLGAIGLALMARCSNLRQLIMGSSMSAPPQPPPPPGLKKTALQQLPTVRYSSGLVVTDCPICLTELAEGDLMRVLPLCGHVFHVNCIDTWLGCRSSCPSCRQVVLEAARCQLCGGSQRRPDTCSGAMDDAELDLA